MNHIQRCSWCNKAPDYKKYHDEEWGKPLFEEERLFECLTLEGAQAGLNWLTILRRRTEYKKAFSNFDPTVIAQFSDARLEKLLKEGNIIRNRLKIKSVRDNACAFLDIQATFGSFSAFQWSFVGGTPIQNQWQRIEDIPTQTAVSQQFSSALQHRGFRFVGPSIMYAYMQATGMVNDHVISCFRHKELEGK